MKSKLMGAGLIAAAACVTYNRWLRKPAPLKGSYAHAPTKVLIVGGDSEDSLRPRSWRAHSAGAKMLAWPCWTV